MSIAGIQMATRSLLAHERALEVTGQNIANAETPGYSRQVAVTRSVSGPGAVTTGAHSPLAAGGGVDVALVMRAHASWLDRSAASLQAQVGDAGISQRYAGQVESLFGEPGASGLQNTLGKFFDAASALASQPDSYAAREGLLRAGGQTASRLKELTDGIDALRSDAAQEVRSTVARVNDLAKQIAGMNETIASAQGSGSAPNELLDQRDQLLAELTGLTGATVSGQEVGGLVVSLGGRTLVQGGDAGTLAVSDNNPFQVVDAESGEEAFIAGGELRGLINWGSNTLPQTRAEIASVRDNLATQVNALHASGRGLDGTTGQAFFVADAKGDLSVNPTLLADPSALAAGDGTAGDGSVARAFAAVGAPTGNLQKSYSALVTKVGTTSAEAKLGTERTRLSLEQVQGMQASESGVNLDEELAHMITLQHAYSASARLLSTFDQMLDTLISRTGG